ncbi:hypothetical protein [Desulforhopalus singaporensis]|uniref:Uncharacterized protein n=1 Tax=Desulforhopalus singaporensis TaxID=91360 RepID=A0A1H0LKL8_9BACT|nr:hypothetical protein [Desulforhopalus singaporensis]SDO68593.1 hypothetical protein SAMN05660330_00833 [Desulforhopalus singaporensis]
MLRKIGIHRRLVMAIVMVSLVSPVISIGGSDKDLGKDWYCNEPEEHTRSYQEHVKYHIDNTKQAIANELEEIFTNQSLTADEKRDKTIDVLNRYLLKIKMGTGD